MHVMNKNVQHNGKKYDKGHIIEESDSGFQDLKKMGHVDDNGKHSGHVDGEEKYKKYSGKSSKSEAEPEAEPEAEADGEEAQDNKRSGRKPRK